MKRPLLLAMILLLGSLSPCVAEAPSEAAPAITSPPITDPAHVTAHYREVLTRPEYQEIPEADIGSRLKDSLSQWFLRLGAKFGHFQYSGEMPAFASLLMTLLVMLSIAGLLYVMIRLTRRRVALELGSTRRNPDPKTFQPPESYDDEIQQSLRNSNWHGAWLAAWRQFLSRLENRRLVEADRTRTNHEYLAQLRAQTLPTATINLLSGMVEAYDKTIYGRKTIDEPEWNQFRSQMEEAALLLHLDEKSAPVRSN